MAQMPPLTPALQNYTMAANDQVNALLVSNPQASVADIRSVMIGFFAASPAPLAKKNDARTLLATISSDPRVRAAASGISLSYEPVSAPLLTPPGQAAPGELVREYTRYPQSIRSARAADPQIARARTENDGYALGPLSVRSQAHAGVTYVDNVFATDTATESDVILSTQARVDVAPRGAEDLVQAFVEGEYNAYTDNDDESHGQWGVGLSANTPSAYPTQIAGRASYHELREPRWSVASPNASVEPIEYSRASGGVKLRQHLGPVTLSARHEAADLTFENGTAADGSAIIQSGGDRLLQASTVRAGWQADPRAQLFAEATYDQRDYDESRFDGTATSPFERDSEGYRVLVGTELRPTRMVRGEVALGYLEQDFDDPRLDNLETVAGRARLTAELSPVTTIAARLDRDLGDAELDQSVAFMATTGSVELAQALTPRLVLRGRVDGGLEEYEFLDREDERIAVGAGVSYALTPNVLLGLDVNHGRRESDGADAGDEFDATAVYAGVRVTG